MEIFDTYESEKINVGNMVDMQFETLALYSKIDSRRSKTCSCKIKMFYNTKSDFLVYLRRMRIDNSKLLDSQFKAIGEKNKRLFQQNLIQWLYTGDSAIFNKIIELAKFY